MKKSVTFILITALFLIGTAPAAIAESSVNRKAMLLSLLVPGLGQYYAGAKGYAKLFLAAELAIWGSYYYNDLMMDAKRQDYLSSAARHAGASPAGQGIAYLNAVGAFNSSFEYNGYQATRDVPVLFPEELAWNWDSPLNRARFKQLREDELDYENNLKYCIAGTVLNHLLSALHAAKQSAPDVRTSAVTVRVTGRGLAAVYTRSY